MDTVPPMTEDEKLETFDYYLRRAVFFGECTAYSCQGIGRETWAALKRVTDERTIESVMAARDASWYDVHGWKEMRAVKRAVEAGQIPHDPRGNSVYYPEMIDWGSADVAATKTWLAANRENPGEIYRASVLDQS